MAVSGHGAIGWRGRMSERFLVLADGKLGVFDAKTTTCLLRYRGDEVVAVLDREHSGRTTREVLGVPADVPIVATLEEGLRLGPTALVIGIAPAGGQLPVEWRGVIRGALEAGLDVISGLHVFLSDDPEFASLAARRGRKLIDLRRPPESQPIAHGRARETRALRVLTVGTDCNIGKMVTALELALAARREGIDARFLATGQTGMLISGSGVTLDRIPGDFMAGVIEEQCLLHGGGDWLVVEGQGCILHPAFSGVTAALLHGTLPDAMILCDYPLRRVMRNQSVPIPPLREWIPLYEGLLRPLHPGRVVGVAVNTWGMDDAQARRAVDRAAEETGLPATDVIRFGAEPLVAAVRSHREGG